MFGKRALFSVFAAHPRYGFCDRLFPVPGPQALIFQAFFHIAYSLFCPLPACWNTRHAAARLPLATLIQMLCFPSVISLFLSCKRSEAGIATARSDGFDPIYPDTFSLLRLR
jgi:hypothetical protein